MAKSETDIDYGKKPDEISIRKLVLKLREFTSVIKKSWYLYFIAALPLGIYSYYKATKVKPIYPAHVTFLLRPKDIAKENKVVFQIYSRLATSKNLIREMLFEPVDSTKEIDYVINYYLQTYFDHKPEDLTTEIPPGFQFKETDVAKFDSLEQLVFKRVMQKITTPVADDADGFITIGLDEALGYTAINVNSPTEELTFLLLERMKNKVINLYRENVIFAEKLAFDEIADETDSLSINYKKTYYELNKLKNRRERMLKRYEDPDLELEEWVKEQYEKELTVLYHRIIRLEVEADVYKMDFLASIEQMKGANIEMNTKSPLVIITEQTLSPIDPIIPSPKSSAIKGSILGIILMIVFVIGRKIYQDILAEADMPEEYLPPAEEEVPIIILKKGKKEQKLGKTSQTSK